MLNPALAHLVMVHMGFAPNDTSSSARGTGGSANVAVLEYFCRRVVMVIYILQASRALLVHLYP